MLKRANSAPRAWNILLSYNQSCTCMTANTCELMSSPYVTSKTCISIHWIIICGKIQTPRQLLMFSHDVIQLFCGSFVTVTFTPEIRLLSRWENESCPRRQIGSEPGLYHSACRTSFSWDRLSWRFVKTARNSDLSWITCLITEMYLLQIGGIFKLFALSNHQSN